MHIRLAENFRALFYAPFYAAHALGFYKGEGVEIELLPSPAPAAAAPALLDGTVDLTWGGPMRVMKDRDEEKGASPLVCFCEVVARDPFCLVGHADPTTFQLSDLWRMRLATVSEVPTPWLCLQHDLRKVGIDPERIDRVTDRTMASNLDALRRGWVDVVQMFEPYVSMAVRDGTGNVLYAASTRGPTVYTTFLATRPGIERNRSAMHAMTRAIARMQDWLAQHSANELAEISADYYPHVAADVLLSSLQRYREAGLWSRTVEVSREGFARLAESLLSGGFISSMAQYEDCVDKSLSS
jgi:NitT/TauT family transport system substrate-binding protein